MGLEPAGYVELPPHRKPGGFDHAAIHRKTARLYVAHTANDALDVIDCARNKYHHSIESLTGVAGALVSDERNLAFTSNRGENTVGIFAPDDEGTLARIKVGVRPNGLAFAPAHNLLLAANVGDPSIAESYTLSIVDVEKRRLAASVPMPGRTRWAVYDPDTDSFYVNIADPAQIVVVRAAEPTRVANYIPMPVNGPHGLDLDRMNRRLFCACDGGKLVVVEIGTGRFSSGLDLSGVPDVISFNASVHHLYVAVGDPGVLDVFDTKEMKRIQTLPTEKGAHTIAFDADRNKVYAFLPETHRAAVFVEANK